MRRQRRDFSGTEKMAILREHLIDKVVVSEVCDWMRAYHGVSWTGAAGAVGLGLGERAAVVAPETFALAGRGQRRGEAKRELAGGLLEGDVLGDAEEVGLDARIAAKASVGLPDPQKDLLGEVVGRAWQVPAAGKKSPHHGEIRVIERAERRVVTLTRPVEQGSIVVGLPAVARHFGFLRPAPSRLVGGRS